MKRIPFGTLPAMSPLFLDYIAESPRVRRFYPQSFSIDSIAAFARQRPALNATHREKLCSALAGDPKSIQKLAQGAAAVITGQQPGLLTGPTYTILKALTVIKLAQALDGMGVPAVPVFWVAAEDHDYQEIESTSILDRDSLLREIRVDLSNPEASPVGWLAFGDELRDAVAQCFSALPDSEFHHDVRRIVDACYRPGASPADAFLKMLDNLFAGAGLILANPLQPELRKLAQPTLLQAVRQNEQIRSAVMARGRELLESGYHEQVKVDHRFTGLFAYRGKSRQALRPEELEGALIERPFSDLPLSANVLLRPAMQDAIFPTAAYVGGPAEVAYFAQAVAVYDALQRPAPPVFPRISATIVEPRIGRVVEKYGIEFEDVLRGRDMLRRKAVATVQGVELFDLARTRISAELESLRAALNTVDPTLNGALDNSAQKVLHQVEALRTKFVNAEARRNEILDRHLEAVSNSLFPEKKLQERVINFTSFLVRYGLFFINHLGAELNLDSREHQVIQV
jgi:bacillithiol biosynthesis cysteine-adding enzyme BshC